MTDTALLNFSPILMFSIISYAQEKQSFQKRQWSSQCKHHYRHEWQPISFRIA